jgi:hypothetical protein
LIELLVISGLVGEDADVKGCYRDRLSKYERAGEKEYNDNDELEGLPNSLELDNCFFLFPDQMFSHQHF